MSEFQSVKLFSLLATLTTREWRELEVFIKAGIAGPAGSSLKLYKVIAPYYPLFNSPDFTRKLLFTGLFGNTTYDDKKLRYALTDLYRLAASFLTFRQTQQNNLAANSLLKETLAIRGAGKAYQSLYNADAELRNAAAHRGTEIFYHRYRDEFVHLNYFLSKQKRSADNPVNAVSRHLDIFFIAQKLQLMCEMLNQQNVLSVGFDIFLKNEIIEQLEKGAFSDVPFIRIYYRILMTLTKPEDELHFQDLQELLRANTNSFLAEELRDMYQFLMNYCIKKINLGDVNYVKTLFDIYKLIIENKIILIAGELSQWDYKNIVVIALRAGESSWVYKFIEEHKLFIPARERENAYIYNLAYYYFSTGDYRKSLTLLRQVEFTDLYYQLDMRAIILKCYYETDDTEALTYHLAAFRLFLARNKLISDYQRTVYRNLVKFTSKLMNAYGNKKKREQLALEIETVKQVADIGWLRKKINEK
jgi:hypothetical protein